MDVNGEADQREAITVPVTEESVSVSTQRTETGAVRLRKRIHEDHVTVDEPLEVETVDVQRVAIGRVVDGEVAIRYEGDVMVIPVVEERAVTVVQRVLVEEIYLRKKRRVEHSAQQVTLKHEEIVIERLDAVSGEWRTIDVDTSAGFQPTHDPPATG